jgi:hypothetical protein
MFTSPFINQGNLNSFKNLEMEIAAFLLNKNISMRWTQMQSTLAFPSCFGLAVEKPWAQ